MGLKRATQKAQELISLPIDQLIKSGMLELCPVSRKVERNTYKWPSAEVHLKERLISAYGQQQNFTVKIQYRECNQLRRCRSLLIPPDWFQYKHHGSGQT
jgi:hypothetical protein